ncbi:MAG: putative toxin-antitoxin system toxin component, PIN family [Bacteroidales bacterium]|nr:putative toxin-antitoxin system toxin component, PIN family [Bacteroidales bacterium]MCM1415382.1 putative toxin-antitoxin system toxin component, PIN family [bacterium]MCM1423315.1 putative toxin-antitoxin system toxin component, PIN family [bacterium]
MSVFAVIDTNVIISVLLTRHRESATYRVLQAVLDGRITPLYHPKILAEYKEVAHRPKFHIHEKDIDVILETIETFGIEVHPSPTGEIIPDMDDLIFYEVTMEKREDDAYLVTGNIKHFPAKEFIVTPAEMMVIIDAVDKRYRQKQII